MRSDPKIEIDIMRERKEYTSDLTDAEWAIIEPLLPEDKAVGRLREVDLREVFNAINDRLPRFSSLILQGLSGLVEHLAWIFFELAYGSKSGEGTPGQTAAANGQQHGKHFRTVKVNRLHQKISHKVKWHRFLLR